MTVDISVAHLGDRSVFMPLTEHGARWLNTHIQGYMFSGRAVVSYASADLTQRLRDAGLVVA